MTVFALSKLNVTLIVALVPTLILACVDVGLISIIRWLIRR